MLNAVPMDASATENELPYAIDLELRVEDRDTLLELLNYPAGPARDEYALEALKIGVLALKRATSAMDGELIKRETDRLLESLEQRLESHAHVSRERMESSLREYFHPESGHFSQRVKQLTSIDGEMGGLLRKLLDGDDSRLAKTLTSHIGENSPLMKMLSPDLSQGLLCVLRTNVETQLAQQRERILKEFSLDYSDSALARLVKEITAKHGDLSKDLQCKIDDVVKEFSLDEENSALSRLVRNVDRAQRTITNEFSLDNEQSALRRLKNELTDLLSRHVQSAAEFQEEVKITLAKLVTKRETEARGTLHGATFEQAVYDFVRLHAQQRCDLIEFVGNQTGVVKNCKVGDVLLELGPEQVAAGARIVIEAKEDASYQMPRARLEIEEARKNRNAQLGIFVFSQRTAPTIEPLTRIGCDVFIAWNPDDPATDPYFHAALEISRALCVRHLQTKAPTQIDFAPIDRAINDIENRAKNLEQIGKSAETIKSSSDRILERVRIDREALNKQVLVLRDAVQEAKTLLGAVDENDS